MKARRCTILLVVAFLLLLCAPSARGETGGEAGAAPPVAQALLREGDFAVSLEAALGLGDSGDETEAESRLAEAGVAPRNGWIADYPVTPDILGEIRDALADAAEGGKLSMGKDAALAALSRVQSTAGLAVTPHGTVTTYQGAPPSPGDYPGPAAVNTYYYQEGPPIVTYYTPPPDYYYLYNWIPYPFWCGSFWFGGYYILSDFHRHVHHGHRAAFVSNHFNDLRAHRIFRVDPVSRFNGRTFAGIGAPHRGRFLSTGVRGSDRRIFNAPRAQSLPGMRPLPGARPAPRRSASPAFGAPVARGHAGSGAPLSRPGSAARGAGGRSLGAAPGGNGPGRFAAPPAGGAGPGGRHPAPFPSRGGRR